jgi:hypothetical protein
MPPSLESLDRLNTNIPEYAGSHPFSKGQNPKFYKEIGDTAEGKTGRTDFFEKNVVGLYVSLGRPVPYAFRTMDGLIRSLDAGCVKFLCNREPPEIDLIRDADGYIVAVKPLAPLLARLEPIQNALTQPYSGLRSLNLPFDLSNPVDERRRVLSEQAVRDGAVEFRRDVFAAWESRCAICRVAVPEVLEAAHIYPYLGIKTNDLRNAILLKSDLHILFDAHLISLESVGPRLVIRTSQTLSDTPYAKYDGQMIRLPIALMHQPASEVLEDHLKKFREAETARLRPVVG